MAAEGDKLTMYEIHRFKIQPLADEVMVRIPPEVVQDVRCMICLRILKDATAVVECMHRFCRNCCETAVRQNKRECPACRSKVASRRDLYDDQRFQGIITAMFPNLKQIEQEDPLTAPRPQAAGKRRERKKTPPQTPVPQPSNKDKAVIAFSPLPGANALPSLSQRFFRVGGSTKVSALKDMLVKELQLTSLEHVELVVRHVPGVGDVVLDSSLTVEDVVGALWNATDELYVHYRSRSGYA